MKGGDLDRRITLQRQGARIDPVFGPQPGEWTPVAERVPAQVKDDLPSKSETVEGGLRMAGRPARVRIRYMAGITSDMRVVVHDEPDQLYEITSTPAEIGRREWTEFTIKAFST